MIFNQANPLEFLNCSWLFIWIAKNSYVRFFLFTSVKRKLQNDILKMNNVLEIGIDRIHSLLFEAHIDVLGQGVNIDTRREPGYPISLHLPVQQRHTKGRLHMRLRSDHKQPWDITIVTITTSQGRFFDNLTIGSSGMVSWTFCSDLYKMPINTSTSWEIWGQNCVKDKVHIMSIDLVHCPNVQEQIVAENWMEVDGTVDGSFDDADKEK